MTTAGRGAVFVCVLACLLAVGPAVATPAVASAAATPAVDGHGAVPTASGVGAADGTVTAVTTADGDVATVDGTATATTPPAAQCERTSRDGGGTAQVFLQTGERLSQTEPTRLHTGTRLTVYLCVDGEPLSRAGGDAWDLSGGAAYQIADRTETAVTLELVGAGQTVDVATQIDRREPTAPTIRVVGLETAVYNETATDGRVHLRFAAAADRRAFERAESNFTAAHDAWERTLRRVPTNGTAVDVTGETQTVTTLTDRYETVERRANGLQQTAVAASATGNDSAAATVVADASATADTARAETRRRLLAYAAAVRERRASAAQTLRLLTVGSLGGGVLVGGLAAGLVVRRKLDNAAYDSGFDSDAGASVTRELLAGGLLVVVGLAVGLGLGGLDFLEVLVGW
ncbi:hypothetical protein RYH80_08225 [Halobaculum sp. MBLA0147]|uniref:hypothetical protein n=1 Tax=Halobaculum sp. MBLA0147 TaxID=3079934 RepID=UPI003524CFC9